MLRYDRKQGRLLELRRFAEAEREQALAAYFAAERELIAEGRSGQEEVVLLAAKDETALHRTHGRYFWQQLLDETRRAVQERVGQTRQ
ncbi:MAG: hypothetical protein N3F11_01770 [Casimicrobiaceae bacterium]|nr:hypothetical protein [Casimicrobiaceae bacterium]